SQFQDPLRRSLTAPDFTIARAEEVLAHYGQGRPQANTQIVRSPLKILRSAWRGTGVGWRQCARVRFCRSAGDADIEGVHGTAETLECELASGLGPDRLLDRVLDLAVDQNLAVLGVRAEPCREVYYGTDCRIVKALPVSDLAEG